MLRLPAAVLQAVAVGLVAVGLFAGCRHESAGAEPPAPTDTLVRRGETVSIPAHSPLRHRLEVEPVVLQNVRRALEAPAQVEADPARLAHIAPPLAGRVLALSVHFGDAINANAPLFTLDSPDLVAAQTDYLRARSQLAQAERTLRRNQALLTQGAGTQREVEESQTEHDVARSELERATMRLRLLHTDAGAIGRPLTVRSPIAGRVVEYSVAPGEYHDPTDNLMTIADLSTVWVTASVQEKDIRRVHANEDATATFAAYSGERWRGQVLFVGDLLDPATRTIRVRIAFENADRRLRPGMFALVTFTETAAPEIVVPSTALVLLGDASYAFVEDAPWTFHRQRVTTGAQADSEHTVVTDGLRVGERIVVTNAVLLQ